MSSSLFLSEFGVNRLARCSTNRIDFSPVERPELHSGCLPGGMGTNGL
jgi:hypothetical protein